MSQNRRSPTAHVIDVFISIHIPDPSALPAIDEERFAAYVAKCAHRRIYAAGNAFLCASKQFGRIRHAVTIAGFVKAVKRHLRSVRRANAYLCSALATTAATTILSALASRRGSQVVRSRSAKPLFAGSIPAPASFHR